MKKRILIYFLVLAVTIGLFTRVSPSRATLAGLSNLGFDTGTKSPWMDMNNIGTVVASGTFTSQNGPCSCKLNGTNGQVIFLYGSDMGTVSVDLEYSCRVWVYDNVDGDVRITLKLMNFMVTSTIAQASVTTSNYDGWKEYLVGPLSTSNTDVSRGRFLIEIMGTVSSADPIYVDSTDLDLTTVITEFPISFLIPLLGAILVIVIKVKPRKKRQ